MRLVLSALILPLRRMVPTGHGLITLTFVALLVGLELAGRLATSDLHDGLAGLVLASATALVVTRHRRAPFPWLNWLVARLSQLGAHLFDWFRHDHGIDLRGTPPIPSRLPPVVWGIVACLGAWAALAALAWTFFPGGWREVGIHTSYVIYLAVLMAVWVGLLLCTFAGIYVPVLLFDRRLRGTVRPSDRRTFELALVASYGLLVATVAWLVPTAVVLGLCLGVTAMAGVAVLRSGQGEPAILWRAGAGRPIYAVPLRRLVAGGLGLASAVVFNLLLMACGGRLLSQPEPSDAMPVTSFLGTTAAWMTPGLIVVAILWLWSARRADPARRTPPTVHLTGDRPPVELKRAAAAILSWGWSIRLAPSAAEPGDLKIELVESDRSQATEFEPVWPLRVSVEDLEGGAVRDRLARRDEIQLRRQALRGLGTLFKRAASERGRLRGGGYWFAPHWWFMTGLEREEPYRGRSDSPAAPRPIGPPFVRVFTPRTRQHLHEVFRAVRIDMIFVDDGVGPRTLQKVLRTVFEFYDRTGGKRSADDHTFRGIPKVKVMVHDYAPGNPFRATGYPEPKFDELNRARVLHVFRDRGGHEAETEVPFDFSWEPSPVLGVR